MLADVVVDVEDVAGAVVAGAAAAGVTVVVGVTTGAAAGTMVPSVTVTDAP
nr:hypothetical protein [Mycobacterium triplex]